MKRNVLIVFGMGALLGAGLFAPGCGSSSSSSPKDAGPGGRFDGGEGGTAGHDGPVFAGNGGTAGLDGAAGTGGSVATGADAEIDAVKVPDAAAPDLVVGRDVADAQLDIPLPMPDGPAADRTPDLPAVDTMTLPPPSLDAAELDGELDVTPDTIQVLLDAENDTEIDSSGLLYGVDSGIDGAIDGAIDSSSDI